MYKTEIIRKDDRTELFFSPLALGLRWQSTNPKNSVKIAEQMRSQTHHQDRRWGRRSGGWER